MINTLIADDNLCFMKGFINTIISDFIDLRVEYCAITGEETVDIISKKMFDLVFLDLQMPKLNGIEVLNKLNVLNLVKIPKIIIVTGDLHLIKEIRKYKNISSVIIKTDSIDSIKNKIQNVITEINYNKDYSSIKLKVTTEVLNLGYNIKHIGTHYLIESIILIYERNDFNLIDNLENNVYKIIAFKHKKTTRNIKTNIIKSTLYIKNTKYTPKYVIADILSKISN